MTTKRKDFAPLRLQAVHPDGSFTTTLDHDTEPREHRMCSMKRFGIEYDKNTRAWFVTDKDAREGYVESDTKDAVKALADKLNQRDDLLAALDEIAGMVESLYATPDAMDDPFWQVARAAIAKAGGAK